MQFTPIQWADSTANQSIGCNGCELFPTPGQITGGIDTALAGLRINIDSRSIFKRLIDGIFEFPPVYHHDEHQNAVTTTNISHLRERFTAVVLVDHGSDAAGLADEVIKKSITCYAAVCGPVNKGPNILDRVGDRNGKSQHRKELKSYPANFEKLVRKPGAMAAAARWPDLLGQNRGVKPWLDGLPRLTFVSDMGDALSSGDEDTFDFLKRECMPAFTSTAGKRHLWLWLSKRPTIMARFAQEVGGFPPNLMAMTTMTSADLTNLRRLADLRTVQAPMRGLSIEPLWSRIPPESLDLTGIDWVIVGGESGSGDLTREFKLEWAEEIRDHCRAHGVAFFMKQIGTYGTRNGVRIALKDPHGGDWCEWPDEGLQVRDFPACFHSYRADELMEVVS